LKNVTRPVNNRELQRLSVSREMMSDPLISDALFSPFQFLVNVLQYTHNIKRLIILNY